MSYRIPAVAATLAGLLAFCTGAESKPLDLVQNPTVRAYAQNELAAGAPSLPVASKLVYREALGDLEAGRRDEAVAKLRLAADLAGNDPAPLFTLARVEALRAEPAFITDLGEAMWRSISGFPEGAVLALNVAAILALSFTLALLAVLVALLVRYRHFIDHAVVERYGARLSPAVARWIVPTVLACLVLLRLGIGLYIAVLVAALWSFLGRRERAVVAALVAFAAAASIASPLSNRLAAAVDPYSVTRRLALVNERSVSADRLEAVRAIDAERYRAERAFAVGTMVSRIGLREEGQRYLLEAVAARPDFFPAFLNLGNVYFLRGDYDRALAGYRNAVELDSTSAVAHYNIGQAYIKKMLFAQSGVWLQKATTLGFEKYRASHPALGMEETAVYEQGFPAADLWRVASAEGASRERVVLSEMLQPWLLFPFHRLWILLAAGAATGLVIARAIGGDRKTMRCDNCGRATCKRCSQTLHDSRLCADCAEVVKDLSSVKVVEALLRTKRQKTASAREHGYRWRTAFFPGMGHACFGGTVAGFALAFCASAALVAFVWKGFYFKNPLTTNIAGPLWQTVLPLAALGAAYALSLRARPPQESRAYNLFAADVRSRVDAPQPPKVDDGGDLWLSPSSAPPVRRKPAHRGEDAEREASAPAAHRAPKSPAAETPLPWESEARHAPAREAKQDAKHPGAPPHAKGAPPAHTGQHGAAHETDDFIAEIKKGSSWR